MLTIEDLSGLVERYEGRFKVMQCLGERDKNGNLIYEDDLIYNGLSLERVQWLNRSKTTYGHGDSSTTVYLGFATGFYGSSFAWDRVEVKGNYWENKNLKL